MQSPSAPSSASAPPLSGRLLRGASLMVAMRWLMRFLGLINIAILARLLTPADFGLVAMAMVAVGLTDGLLNVGVDRAVLQRGQGDARYFGTAWTMRCCQGLLIACVIAAIAAPAASYYDEPRVRDILLIAAAGIAVRSFESIGVVLLRQELLFRREFFFQLCTQLVGVVVTLSLAFHLRSYLALVFGMVAKEIAQTLLSYVFAPYRPRVTLSAWRDLLSVSQWALVFNVVMTIYARLGYLMLGRIADAAAVGRLNMAVELASIPPNEIAAPIARAFFPGFVKLRDDRDRYRAAFLVSMGAMALIASAVCLGFALVAEELVTVVLGGKWLSVIPLVQICAVGGLFRILEVFFIEQAFVFARIKAMTLMYAACAATYAISLPSVYGRFGLEGAAMLGLILVAASAVGTGLLAARAADVGGTDAMRCLKRPFFAGLVMTVGVVWFASSVDLSLPLMLVAKVALGGTLFVGTAAAIWHLEGRPDSLESRMWDKGLETLARLRRRGRR